MANARVKVAIIGSGNIGCDLMMKIHKLSTTLELVALVGIDEASDGLKRAARMGIIAIADGVDGLIRAKCLEDIAIVFDATSADAHIRNAERLRPHGKTIIDLTPAAIGPFVVPSINLEQHLDAGNINMVTCGGQATIPIVAAINKIAPVRYAEIVASIASRSAGPGTRANIDEFTETTARAIESVGGAAKGKAIIILNPAEPPLIMRDTVFCLCADACEQAIADSIERMVAEVSAYVPGYRLKQAPQFERIEAGKPIQMADTNESFSGLKVTVYLEVEGAAHYLPAYAGNLDIMTSAALQAAERIAEARKGA